jgi:DNA-binding LacI/PurR family transcriptional regulator
LLLRQNVEAIVLIAAHAGALEAILSIELGVPLVAVDAGARAGVHSVALDQYAGARAAVDHLIALGHTQIRHISGPLDSTDATERVRGWRDSLAAAGLVAREHLVGDWTPASGFRHGQTLAADAEMTAVFVGNDQMSLRLIHALTQAGREVPGDVSVVGFDDIPEAEHFAPPLTTIRQDFDGLGCDIMTEPLAVLRDEDAADLPCIVPSLVVRESAGPPHVITAVSRESEPSRQRLG